MTAIEVLNIRPPQMIQRLQCKESTLNSRMTAGGKFGGGSCDAKQKYSTTNLRILIDTTIAKGYSQSTENNFHFYNVNYDARYQLRIRYLHE